MKISSLRPGQLIKWEFDKRIVFEFVISVELFDKTDFDDSYVTYSYITLGGKNRLESFTSFSLEHENTKLFVVI